MIPWKTILLEVPCSFVLQLCCAFMCTMVCYSCTACTRYSLHQGRADCPGWELPEHIPAQSTHRSSTSGTRDCINKFTQLNWSTPPAYGPQFAPKAPPSCGKSTFSLKTCMFAPLRHVLMPTFHTKVSKQNIFPSNHWIVLRHLFLKVTLQGFHSVSLYLFSRDIYIKCSQSRWSVGSG